MPALPFRNLGPSSAGGELVPAGNMVPAEFELRDTVESPDLVTADASRDRLQQAQWAGVLETALDAADTIGAKNAFEKMHAHQMALVHKHVMRLGMRLEDMQHHFNEWSSQQKNVEQCRVHEYDCSAYQHYQQGLLVLPRLRSGRIANRSCSPPPSERPGEQGRQGGSSFEGQDRG